MSKPRAVMVDIPRLKYDFRDPNASDILRQYAGQRRYVCCPYCNSKITVEWKYTNPFTFGWMILTRCPHLRNFGRGSGAIAFYKNPMDIKKEEQGYLQQFGNEVAKIYRYWYFYQNTTEKCEK